MPTTFLRLNTLLAAPLLVAALNVTPEALAKTGTESGVEHTQPRFDPKAGHFFISSPSVAETVDDGCARFAWSPKATSVYRDRDCVLASVTTEDIRTESAEKFLGLPLPHQKQQRVRYM